MNIKISLILLVFVLTACSSIPNTPNASSTPELETTKPASSLPIIRKAPELHNEVWLNSDPLKLADLRGQVTIVEFWTFG